MAEIEFAALSKQCLERRLPDLHSLRQEVLAWRDKRNQKCETVHFFSENAELDISSFYDPV